MKKLLLTLSILLVFPALSFAETQEQIDAWMAAYTLTGDCVLNSSMNGNQVDIFERCGGSTSLASRDKYYLEDYQSGDGSYNVHICDGSSNKEILDGIYYRSTTSNTIKTYCDGHITEIENIVSGVFTSLSNCHFSAETFDCSQLDILVQTFILQPPDGTTTEQTILEDGTIVDTSTTILNGEIVEESTTYTSPDTGDSLTNITKNNSDGSITSGQIVVLNDDGVETTTELWQTCTETVELGTICGEQTEDISQAYATSESVTTSTNIETGEVTTVTETTNPLTGETSTETSVENSTNGTTTTTKDINKTGYSDSEVLEHIKEGVESLVDLVGDTNTGDTSMPDVTMPTIPELPGDTFNADPSELDGGAGGLMALVDTTYMDQIGDFVSDMVDTHPLIALANQEHFVVVAPECQLSFDFLGQDVVIDFCQHSDLFNIMGTGIVLIAGISSLMIAVGKV